MKSISATQARNNIYQLLKAVDDNHEPIQILGKHNNAVLISESDWAAIQETLYLSNIPGMHESIKKGLKIPLDKCRKDLDW